MNLRAERLISANSSLVAVGPSDGTIGLTLPVVNDGVGSDRGPKLPVDVQRDFGSKNMRQVTANSNQCWPVTRCASPASCHCLLRSDLRQPQIGAQFLPALREEGFCLFIADRWRNDYLVARHPVSGRCDTVGIACLESVDHT